MDGRLRRAAARAGCVALALPAVAVPAVLAATPAPAAGCKAATDLVSADPVASYKLPGGVKARVWDTGSLLTPLKQTRLAVVTIPKGTLTPRVYTSPTLTSVRTPSEIAGADKNVLVAINGAVFAESWPGTPDRSQILDGVVRKGTWTAERGLAVYTKGKSAAVAKVALAGSATSARGTITVGAVNWQYLSAKGLTVYTRAWGQREHPVGPRTVVVKNGVVVSVLRGREGENRPSSGQRQLTARAGSTAADKLAKLKVGDKVKVSFAPTGRIQKGTGTAALGAPDGLIGISSTVLEHGVNVAVCNSHNEILRPRTAIGWNSKGDIVIAAISGRLLNWGIRYGGATVHQWGEYLKQLGVRDAAIFDGGNSTELLIRRAAGGKFIRLDRLPGDDFERPVTDILGFRVRG